MTGDPAPDPGVLHGVPTKAELVEAVREFLASEVLDVVDTRLRFHTRVAINVLAMVERELALGPDQATAHRERLAGLGFADEAELAAAIRAGRLDARWDEVKAAVWASVADRLAVANPSYADDRTTGPTAPGEGAGG